MARVILTQSKECVFDETEIFNTVKRALDKLDFGFSDRIKTVVIKPNMCYYWNASTGETTDPRVVSAVIDYVRLKLGKAVDITVAEADASAMKTNFAFRVLGYDTLCQAKNVKLRNLSEGTVIERIVKVRGKEFSLPVNEILLNSDLVISIPKLKTHNFVGSTCALKNMFGAISKPRKFVYHKRIADVITGINKIVKSNIVVVDGVIARGTCTKNMGVIIAGDDALATDFVATRIMGFNPYRIPYLKLAAKEHVGQMKNIELIEDVKLGKLKKDFPGYNLFLHNLSWSMQLKLLRSYVRVVGDVLPPFMENQ